MELGLVRSAVAGVTQPTPQAPDPVRTANRPELDRARAVETLGPAERQAARRERSVALNTLPPATVDAPPPGAGTAEPGSSPASTAAAVQAALDLQRRFDIDEPSKQVVFRMIDVSTGEVVRQFPQENRLRLQEMLRAFGNALPSGRNAGFDGSF